MGTDGSAAPPPIVEVIGALVAVVGLDSVPAVVVADPIISSHFRWSTLDGETS